MDKSSEKQHKTWHGKMRTVGDGAERKASLFKILTGFSQFTSTLESKREKHKGRKREGREREKERERT